MTEPQARLQDYFSWPNKSRFPGLELLDKRVPQLYLAERTQPDDVWRVEVYLVNNTGMNLEKVKASTGGSATVDIDDPDGWIMKEPGYAEFCDVLSGEAVKVAEYHRMYDSDYVLGVEPEIESKVLGKLQFNVWEKGGFDRQSVLWKEANS